MKVDTSLSDLVDRMSIIDRITIEDFLKKFSGGLAYIPFELNEMTFQNFIDYYSLNFELDGNTIINNDYSPLVINEDGVKILLSPSEINEKLQEIKRRFKVIYSIEESLLAEFVELSPHNLRTLMFECGRDAGINYYYSAGIYYNKDKIK